MRLKGEVVILSRPKKIIFKSVTIDSGKIKPSEIIAKTIFSAISPGTETAAYSGQTALRPGRAYPRLLGYSNVAKVLVVGKAVKKIRPGDNILTNQSHRSIFLIKEENVLARVPRKIDPKEATLTYLYTIGLGALQIIPLGQEKTLAVIGLGVLGLSVVEQAKNLNVHTIAFSDSQYKLKLAKKLGSTKVYLKSKNRKLQNLADMVIITSNSWEDWALALKLTRPNGVITVVGFPGRGQKPPSFNPLLPQYFYYKNITILPIGSLWAKKTKAKTVKENCLKILTMIGAKKLKPKSFISGVYYYKDIAKAYEKILARDQKSITYILQWQK